MNKLRELFLLFRPDNIEEIVANKDIVKKIKEQGYELIYAHSFPNDEPPYIQVTFWGEGVYHSSIYLEDGETLSYYFIRKQDVINFVVLQNDSQRDYCDYYVEGVYTRNVGEHDLSARDYAETNYTRPPKVKCIWELPNTVSI